MRILFSINTSLALLRSPRAPAPIRSLLFGSNKSSSSVSRSATMMSIPPSISAVSLCEEALAGRLWIKFNRECLFSMYSPFAVSLAAGNLKIETFRQYIAQDVHFLKAFAHAWVIWIFLSVVGFWNQIENILFFSFVKNKIQWIISEFLESYDGPITF